MTVTTICYLKSGLPKSGRRVLRPSLAPKLSIQLGASGRAAVPGASGRAAVPGASGRVCISIFFLLGVPAALRKPEKMHVTMVPWYQNAERGSQEPETS